MAAGPHLIPAPSSLHPIAGCAPFAPPRTVGAGFDPAARSELDRRWRAQGIGALRVAAQPDIVVRFDRRMRAQAYRLTLRGGRATIVSRDAVGAFYAAMTLAQLPVRVGAAWQVPCLRIDDRPALRWRILSDDVSRGPLPTMRYFERRIRTIAAFKMNGYSPYMEQTFISPTDPLPAPLDGITPAQLAALARYAARYHVAFIPQQQTFAHMHNTLKLERYAAAAALPHGFLMAPNVPLTDAYLARLIGAELAAVPHPPFFHIGSDETVTLGDGRTQAYVHRVGRARAYADHIAAMNALIAPSGARVMLWDDGIEADPAIMPLLPHDAVIVNWHYDDERSFVPHIQLIARGGFEQMVDPGDDNWNQIFPNVAEALRVERRFIDEGKAAHVLGLYESVWNDDGESLYGATWYPVLYAAASAWQAGSVAPARFAADFPSAFFGVDDPNYAHDVTLLGRALDDLQRGTDYNSDALAWAPIFDAPQLPAKQVSRARLDAEAVEQDLYFKRPPLHRHAAAVMFLAARRFDVLGRAQQVASEVRAMYAQARRHVGEPHGPTVRDLFWCRYWMWELRDDYEDLARLYGRAWTAESRPDALAPVLERYHLAAQRAIALGEAFYRATYDDYVPHRTLPPFASVIR